MYVNISSYMSYISSYCMLRNRDLSFWTPVNFGVEYFLNEETDGVLTETVRYLYDQQSAPNLAISTQT